MPLYEYQCEACGARFEVIRKFSDPPLEICTQCGAGPVQRLLSSPAIQFKGSGWYITDYSQKGKAPAAEKADKDKADTGGKTPATGGGSGSTSSSEKPAATSKSDTPAPKPAGS